LKIVLCVAIGIIALSLAACSKVNEEKSPTTVAPKAKFRNTNKMNRPYHGDLELTSSTVPISLVLKSLKKNHLDISSTKTIGDAFDSYKYAIKSEWRETPTNGGSYYIDYICWFHVSPVSYASLKEGIVKRGLEIKFVVHEDGETFIAMGSRIDIKSDGMLYTTPLEAPELKKNVTAIYENREITF